MLSPTSTQPQPSSRDDIQERVWFEHGSLVRESWQPTRRVILEEVQRRRDNPGSVIDVGGFGRCALTIPQYDFQQLVKKYPDLICPNGEEQTLAWKKFLASSESEPYRNHGNRNAYRKNQARA